MNNTTQRRVLVAGGGYLGRRVAMLEAARGAAVTVTTRSRSRAQALRADGFEVIELALPRAPDAATAWHWPAAPQVLYFLMPPGALAGEGRVEAALDSLEPLLEAGPPARVVLSSSTVVYGDQGGARVDAGSAAAGQGPRAERQLAIEAWWQARGLPLAIVRLAGLYGPGRIIGAAALARGEAVTGDPDAWLNLIHIDDAAALVYRLGSMDAPPAISLGVDDEPVRRRDYYGFVAASIGASLRFEPAAASRDSRRCDNTPTRLATGWVPTCPSYREGVAAGLAADAG